MRKLTYLLIGIALGLLVGGSCLAQVSVGAGGTINLLKDEDGDLHQANELFGEVEYQMALSSRHWLGALIATDGSGFTGTGMRYYYGPEDALAFPGIGIGIYALDSDASYIEKTTAVLGAEVLIELNIPVGEGSSIPLLISGGWYPSIGGDDVDLIRFGARFVPDLLQTD